MNSDTINFLKVKLFELNMGNNKWGEEKWKYVNEVLLYGEIGYGEKIKTVNKLAVNKSLVTSALGYSLGSSVLW